MIRAMNSQIKTNICGRFVVDRKSTQGANSAQWNNSLFSMCYNIGRIAQLGEHSPYKAN